MKFTKQRYQNGSIRGKSRKTGPDVWEFRYRDHSRKGSPQSTIVLSTTQYSTKSKALTAIQSQLSEINGSAGYVSRNEPSFGLVIDKFITSERLEEIRKQRVGEVGTIEPTVLNVDQFHRLLAELKDPYHTMVILAMCSGFRALEIASLVWESIDWQHEVLYARQGAVHGRIGRLKTEVSDDEVPMEESFAKALRSWGTGKPMSGLVFPSSTGGPSHMGTVLQEHIRPAARRAGVELRGWHTFRHTYRAILGETDAPIGVQQKLMRHAQILTTHEYIWKRLHLCEKEGELQGCRNSSARSIEQDSEAANA